MSAIFANAHSELGRGPGRDARRKTRVRRGEQLGVVVRETARCGTGACARQRRSGCWEARGARGKGGGWRVARGAVLLCVASRLLVAPRGAAELGRLRDPVGPCGCVWFKVQVVFEDLQ